METHANSRAAFSGLAFPEGPKQYELVFVATRYAEHVVTVEVSAAP